MRHGQRQMLVGSVEDGTADVSADVEVERDAARRIKLSDSVDHHEQANAVSVVLSQPAHGWVSAQFPIDSDG